MKNFNDYLEIIQEEKYQYDEATLSGLINKTKLNLFDFFNKGAVTEIKEIKNKNSEVFKFYDHVNSELAYNLIEFANNINYNKSFKIEKKDLYDKMFELYYGEKPPKNYIHTDENIKKYNLMLDKKNIEEFKKYVNLINRKEWLTKNFKSEKLINAVSLASGEKFLFPLADKELIKFFNQFGANLIDRKYQKGEDGWISDQSMNYIQSQLNSPQTKKRITDQLFKYIEDNVPEEIRKTINLNHNFKNKMINLYKTTDYKIGVSFR